jgi:hypothetical protein
MIDQGVGGTITPAQVGDPSALLALSGPAYAALSFVSILVAAVLLLSRREAVVDRAVDRATQGLPLAAVYGVIPFATVVFVGGYILSQTTRIGVTSRLLVWVLAAVVVVAMVVLAGLGYLVAGGYVTELEGERRLWTGAVVGAGLSALPWLLLPTLPAAVVWIVVAAVGLGGTTQKWVHGERTVETEARG